jgi:hypothetical protein
MDIRAFFQRIPNPVNIFTSAGTHRESNDSSNKQRETILVNLYHSTDSSLQELRKKWVAFLDTLCYEPYDNVIVKHQGGRKSNYDFEISYFMKGQCIKTIHAEYKHNTDKIENLPEYFSPAADKQYTSRLYADFFYDYLDEICDVYPGLYSKKPDRQTYVYLVHNNDYDRHPFFRTLYNMEINGTEQQYKQKKEIVSRSIYRFLEEYCKNINLIELSNDIYSRQNGKVFILWNLREFKSDIIRKDEMELTHIEGIKNGNTLIVVSKSGTKHNMLLRWKNHIGIMYPAWQISLSR